LAPSVTREDEPDIYDKTTVLRQASCAQCHNRKLNTSRCTPKSTQ
jgi:hypothetical protein